MGGLRRSRTGSLVTPRTGAAQSSENPSRRTSQNNPSETVWKIAEVISTVPLRWQQAGTRPPLDPSWPPSEPLFRDPSRFSKQFRKVNSQKLNFRFTEFYSVMQWYWTS